MASNVVDLPNPRGSALADLKRSGLTEKDFKSLRLRALTGDETQQATEKYRYKSMLIPYFDMYGKETAFFRLRFLEDVRAFGKQKGLRYYQPPDTPPRAYLAPYMDWQKIFGDPKTTLWITEGEKKAAKACKEGFACIGLGGVWSWKSSKQRQPLLPEFIQMKLEKREIVLCFDSDSEEKPDVEGALAMLGAALEMRGAVVYRVQLPLPIDSDKMGLDDFLMAHSGEALNKLPRERLAMSAQLFKLNEELAVIDDLGAVLRIKQKVALTNTNILKDIVYADRRVTTTDASGRLVEVSAAAQWLKWPGRRRHSGMVYEPGQATITPDGKYNLWSGWGCQPKKGDPKLFVEYIDYMFRNSPGEYKRWFIQWLAYPLIHPGCKMFSCVLLWSTTHGSGKSMIGKTMGYIYGDNYGVVTEDRLHSTFNDWIQYKQFILGEEVTGVDRKAEMNRLKYIISGETIEVNKKYQAQVKHENKINILFTSNQPDAFILEDKDRRYFVHELTGETLSQKFFARYVKWLEEKEDAAPSIFAHLLETDVSDFNPHAPPPFTEAKHDMIRLSGTEVDLLVRQLYESPERYLKLGESPVTRDLYTLDELQAALDPDGKKRITNISLAKALRRQGYRELGVTKVTRGTIRLWAVRNIQQWEKADHAARVAGYEGETTKQKPAKKAAF
jgi:hypothetical protein